MAGVAAAYGRNDARSIRRDSLLLGVAAGPFMYAAAMWFLPALTRYLDRDHGFDLVPYHALVLSAFVVIGPVAVLGAVCGLLLIEDKDQRTLAALRITPAPPSSYPLYRAGTTIAATALSLTASMALTGQIEAEVVAASVPVTLLCGLNAAAVGFGLAALAHNKVEALALIRAIGLLLFGLPLVPFFYDHPALIAFGAIPTYWPAKAFWEIWDGGNPWPYLAAGALYAGSLAWWLLRRLASQKH
ncbi:ABC transporter permease [Glycomyces albidus]|jgi:fluoroquinolone transport system permease protein|uniref:ABC transporter permease n=1 Tax=Glycomyces albidus TaxID=2656774 RepID=A0A6L5G8X7_9ACTN|nr:ABC transporter permease [Glycomyces albidus]MQM26142.1 ABC transporter permease [Glycomyces albidus]